MRLFFYAVTAVFVVNSKPCVRGINICNLGVKAIKLKHNIRVFQTDNVVADILRSA